MPLTACPVEPDAENPTAQCAKAGGVCHLGGCYSAQPSIDDAGLLAAPLAVQAWGCVCGGEHVTSEIDAGAIAGAIVGAVIAVGLVACAVVYWQRRSAKKKINALKAELQSFKESVVGVRSVLQDYDPRHGDAESLPGGEGGGEERGRGESTASVTIASVDAPAPAAPAASAAWYWAEDGALISKHNPADVKQPGNWVRYAGSVCHELDRAHAAHQSGSGPQVAVVDLTDRIGSTGTEAKAHDPRASGVVFQIDFGRLVQINAKTGFERKVLREPHAVPKSPAKPSEGSSALPLGVKSSTKASTRSLLQGGARKSINVSRVTASPSKLSEGLSSTKPAELAEEDSLILHTGQLVNTSQQRSDGWAFGNVVYDLMEDRPPISVDGLSVQAGWFPLSVTTHPTPDELSKLQTQMGGGADASQALSPPSTWASVKDPLLSEMTELGEGPERAAVVSAFMRTLAPNVKVTSVARIQNLSMWQSYAVKRQSILARETREAPTSPGGKGGASSPFGAANPFDLGGGKRPAAAAADSSRFERVWLFHGTDSLVVPKIIQMGFNRSFCGKNATRFGKGVYFARDASYSSAPQYSRPDASGAQHMFAVRVVIGEYCQGKNDALTPDVRQGHQLYDSTVNDPKNPSIFVTYHDAQAYPEYLIKFRQ